MYFSGFRPYAQWVNRGPRTLSAYTSREYFVVAAVVFAAYFLTGQLGLYILIDLQSLPAVIWPPAGIAMAAIFLFGYRLWLPIALAQILITLSAPFEFAPLVVMIDVAAATLQALLGGYALRRLGFDGSLSNFTGVIILLGVSLAVSVIYPLATVAIHSLLGTPGLSPWTDFSRGWAGGVMSALVMVPLITPWFRPLSTPFVRNELFETGAALLIVSAMSYVVFWTELASLNIFVTLFFLFAVFFWIGLRLRPRIMTLSLFIMAALGMIGSIITQPTPAEVSQQLFATELFVILVAPIFLILSSVVTERVRAITQYAERTKELERALERLSAEDKAKAEFIATLAHELRNPLSPVMSALELLKIKDIPEDIMPLIASAQIQTEHMKRLLDDLLDAARLAQRSFTLKKEPVELATAVFQSISSAQGYLESRHHRLSVSLPPSPLWLEADPVRLEQILVNLLNNASKYTNPGGSVALTCEVEDGILVISVADSGIGIEQERLERIFEPFGGSEGNTRRPGGLRLGLSLAKRMAELHGGALSVESEGRDRGSIFTVRLPLPPEPLRAPAPAPRSKSAVGVARTILIVDDNEAAALGLAKLLEHEGHTVHTVYDGRSALEAIPRLLPDVVLLDIGLPDIDGYEIAQRVRRIELSPEGPVPTLVALTGYGQDSDKRRAQEAGFAHHLTKPVGITELRRVIERIKPVSALGVV